MANPYFSASTSASISLTQGSLSLQTLKARKHILAVFIGSSILISIVVITIILCFVDRLHKKMKTKKSLIKTNGIINHSPYLGASGKRLANSSPLKSRFCYDDDQSPRHNYTSLKPIKPIIVVASTSSHSSSTASSASSSSATSSSSSVGSTTHSRPTHDRTMNTTYSYAAIGTSDDFMPTEFDEHTDDIHSGVELMMTTV